MQIPVHELRSRIPISEFLEWLEYLRQEEERDTKDDWYWAQIAAECRRSFVAHPDKVRIADFLLSSQRESVALEQGEKSKAAWAAFLGVDVKAKRN